MDFIEAELPDLVEPPKAEEPAPAEDRDHETASEDQGHETASEDQGHETASEDQGHETASSDGVELKQRFIIYPDQVLLPLSTDSAVAFHAQSKADTARPFYALLPSVDVPARTDVLEGLRNLSLPGLLRLVEWGKVYWPSEKSYRFILVFERPGGGARFLQP